MTFVLYLQICSIFTANIPGEIRAPLRIAVLQKRWEPTRVPTPRFIDAWTCFESDGDDSLIPVLLDSYCENIAVWRPSELDARQRMEMFVDEGEMSFARVYAKSGSGREDLSPIEDEPSTP